MGAMMSPWSMLFDPVSPLRPPLHMRVPLRSQVCRVPVAFINAKAPQGAALTANRPNDDHP